MRFAVAVLMFCAATNAWPDDKDGLSVVLGNMSCGQYVKSRTESQGGIYAKGWIAGYLAGYNTSEPNTFNILGSTDFDSALLWVDGWCKANPLGQLGEAIWKLTKELYPKRHRTKREAGL